VHGKHASCLIEV